MTLTEQEIAETMNKAIEWGKDGRLQATIDRLIAQLDSGEVVIHDVPTLLAWLDSGKKK